VVPHVPAGHVARCVRCGARIAGGVRNVRGTRRAWYAAWAALLLYPLAVSLPILRIERMGETHESSVWSGSLGLMANGDVALGLVVFACSVVVPLAKLATLLVLIGAHARVPFAGRLHAWHALELTGRFGMLDVLLVSVLVAWLELGAWVQVTAGPAAAAFGACVLLSLLASAWFDPHALLEEEAVAGAAA
jgi:uncharacterized paraquat-inducible protein A